MFVSPLLGGIFAEVYLENYITNQFSLFYFTDTMRVELKQTLIRLVVTLVLLYRLSMAQISPLTTEPPHQNAYDTQKDHIICRSTDAFITTQKFPEKLDITAPQHGDILTECVGHNY